MNTLGNVGDVHMPVQIDKLWEKIGTLSGDLGLGQLDNLSCDAAP